MRLALLVLWVPVVICGEEAIDGRLRRADESFRRGDYTSAMVDLVELEQRLESSSPTRQLVSVKNLLGRIHADQTNYRGAERSYLGALALCEQLPQSASACRVAIRSNLLSVYLQMGRLNKAERVVDEVRPYLGAASPSEKGQFLDAAASLLRLQKRFVEAEELYKEALDLARTTGNLEAEGFLWNSRGVLRANQGKRKEAAEAFRFAIEALERHLGEIHPALIPSLTNLGEITLKEGLPEQAAPLFERAGRIAEHSLGASSPALYHTLLLQAKALERLKRKQEAKQARARAEAVRQGLRPQGFAVDFDELRQK